MKKVLCTMLASLVAVTAMVGCNNGGSTSSTGTTDSSSKGNTTSSSSTATTDDKGGETENGGVDLSKKVHLVMWSSGTASRDHERVADKLSELAERDLNATLEWNRWADSSKLNLLLTSGEVIDLMYSANYINYAVYAAKGAYSVLDDLVPSVSPALAEYVTEDMWNATRVNGNIYMVPCMWPEYVPYGFLWREDLRKKYDLPEIDLNDLSTIEAYLDCIMENEPDMKPLAEVVSSYGSLGSHFTTWEFLDHKYQWIDFRVPYGLSIDYFDPTKVTNWWETEEFSNDMKMFKEWADKGYWSRSSLANTESKQDQFEAGTLAADLCFNAPSGYANLVARVSASHPDWELGWYPMYRAKQLATPNHATQNGMSIPITSTDPERAVLLLEKLVLDEEWYDISQYGFEGEHYNRTADGYYEAIGDASASGFAREAGNLWSTRNTEFMLYPEATAKILTELNAEFDTYAYPNIWTGFAEDTESYQSERAALANVVTQYLPPIQAGLVDDVDTAIDELLEKAEQAGLSKVRDEYTKQWLAYVDEMGLAK